MSTINQSFKVVQLNAENLFLFMDFHEGQNLNNMTEVQWQNLSSSSESNKPLMKTKWLAEALLDMNPDLVLMSEVGGWESLQNFNRHFLGDKYEALLVEGNSDRGIDVGYLLKKELGFSSLLISHKEKPLKFNYPLDPDGKVHFFSRDALELRLFLPGQENPWLCAFNLHLKSKLDRDGIDPKGVERRRAELKAFLEVFRETRKELGRDCHYLVGGDFNGIHSPQNLSESEFSALYDLNDDGSDSASSDKFNLREVFEYCQIPQAERATQIQFHSGPKTNYLQLDGIWVSEGLSECLISEQTKVYLYKSDLGIPLPYAQSLGQRQAMPSDHYPVQISINLVKALKRS